MLIVTDLAATLVCFLIAYFHPEWMADRKTNILFVNAFTEMMIPCIMIFASLLFQMYMFRQERQVAENRRVQIDALNRERVEQSYDTGLRESGLTEHGTDVKTAAKTKKRVVVTADSAADLPDKRIRQYDIRVIRHVIHTEKGSFLDGAEMNGDELMFYMRDDAHEARSEVPGRRQFESFFAEQLQEAEDIIHISIANDSSPVWPEAEAAAKYFDHVHVVDSGSMSGGAGLLALYAAHLAQTDLPVEDMLKRILKVKTQITAKFVLDTTAYLRRGGRMTPLLSRWIDAFLMHPLINMKDDRMKFFIIWGATYRRRFIRLVFAGRRHIDRSLLMITYAGVPEEVLQDVQERVRRYVKFDRVVLMPCSSAIAVNVGPGTFGFMFHNLNDDAETGGRLFDFLEKGSDV